MKIIAKQLAIKLNEEISEEQAGFRPGKGTRDQIMNLKIVPEKNREVMMCLLASSTTPKRLTLLHMISFGMIGTRWGSLFI